MNAIINPADCIHCKLNELCLPLGLIPEDIFKLQTTIQHNRPIKPDTHLYCQEDKSQSLFIVKSGSFRNTVANADGSEQTIGFYLPGELIGLDSLQDGFYHSHVVALETSTVCELPLANLNNLSIKIPGLHFRLMHLIGAQIVSSYEQIVQLGCRSALEKMANFLLMLSERYQALGYSSLEFKLSMSRCDIANFLGLSVEMVSRQLDYLSNKNFITVKQHSFQIHSMLSLKLIAKPCLPNNLHFIDQARNAKRQGLIGDNI